MKILGIETSCDETAAAVVEDGRHLLSNVVASSMNLHEAYGGVVPEIAARSHIEHIMPVVERALQQALQPCKPRDAGNERNSNTHDSGFKAQDSCWDEIDGIAVTQGPGLGGSLLVGLMTARTLAIIKNKPLYALNHVAAHPFAAFLTSTPLSNYVLSGAQPGFPMLALIISGGHSQLVLFRGYYDYTLLGQTRDDAVGEAFDKVAKILGLPYPGGPSVSKKAAAGDPFAFKLPKAKLDHPYEFSFSGLKTAVLRALQAECGKSYDFPSFELADLLSEVQKADMAASFQRVAIETLVGKTAQACKEFSPKSVVVAGGVAANQELRRQLNTRLALKPIYPDIKLCTDNAAMIAALGCLMAQNGRQPADPYTLDISPNLSM